MLGLAGLVHALDLARVVGTRVVAVAGLVLVAVAGLLAVGGLAGDQHPGHRPITGQPPTPSGSSGRA
jgi:hypothetical protein